MNLKQINKIQNNLSNKGFNKILDKLTYNIFTKQTQQYYMFTTKSIIYIYIPKQTLKLL